MKREMVNGAEQLEGGSTPQQSSFSEKNNQPPGLIPSHSPPLKPDQNPLVRRLFRSTAFLTTAIVSATVGVTLAMLTPLPSTIAPHNSPASSLNRVWSNGFQYSLSRPVNILVMGIDRVPGAKDNSAQVFAGRSDTMLLLHLDPTDNSVSMLSIPRDTQVQVPGVGTDKINDANVTGGPALAAQVVSKTLNDVSIDRYVRVSTDAFRELVDLLGGVQVYVPEPMVYNDQTQKLKINLKQGWQTLNGDKAEQFARFRHDSYGDIGRVQRQQALLKALRSRLASPTVIPRIPGMIQVMQKYIDTNLSLEEMLALVGMGLKLDQGNLKMVMLPGRFSAPDEYIASYWIMNLEGRDRVMQDYFKLDDTTTPRSANTLRIAVQNASGNPQAASQVVNYLTNLGYNTYVVQDWTDAQQQTQIIVQQGDLQAATDLTRVLGVGNVEAASTGDLESDLTIRVGKDWSSKK